MDQFSIEEVSPYPVCETYSEDERLAYFIITDPLKENLLSYGLDPEYFIFSHQPLETSQYSSIYFSNDNNLFCRIRLRKKKRYIQIPARYEKEAVKYTKVEHTKSDPDYIRIPIITPQELLRFGNLFKYMLDDVLESYPTDFGCCSRYVECSDSKKCINPDNGLAIQ